MFSTWCTIQKQSYLTLHRVRINLAHVLAPILLLNALDVQVPGGVVAVRDRHARVVGDHMFVNRLDRLRVRLHPAYLLCTGIWTVLA